MPRLPSAKQTIRVVEKLGFILTRQKGSHVICRHLDGRRITIPIHAGKEISPCVFGQILKDLNLSSKDFWNL